MDLEELSMRLGSLERARASDMQKAAQQAFMDKYGSRISNNTSLGLIILNELNRKGIDTSAADEAVQEILDQLRMEATMLLDTIKDNMEQGSELLDKINELGTTVLVVTHERELVDRFSKRVIAIDGGRIISDGINEFR